ncbi:MAG: hypothetical protein PWR24_192 [Desulfonauticus sp.]|jgi:small redox-active disulfide protein 2|nr:MAG: Redox-active disulfide protein 2 [Desulfonauticus sp. 38_4375]MDK2920635.1 hypothetical protein [Desulfonauticus sp.]
MEVKVLGPGCPNCEKTMNVVMDAIRESGIMANVTKVTDYAEIAKMGVLSTPGVVVDGQVKCAGKVPTKEEVISWLKGE